MTVIKRVTLFKIPDESHQDVVLEQYKKMEHGAVKDGKPYILSLSAGKTKDDQRRKGYTLCALSTFASVDDMKYYDTDCEAHKALKAVVATGRIEEMPLTVFMEVEE
ncbi:hypothetical protein H072_7160 [Dactylellina haptotyla CBS 200.50]|uniref:Stress-response A/B barrel domain-containing protein n=1 Tax=Dactylellina haptotyla (strain CBS 200.50) TaxID=1284197 RepID=S8BUT6_DACHA|nr:hypothetical protein H072_7160 [Dactylellina haptotyla CBS 200.50]